MQRSPWRRHIRQTTGLPRRQTPGVSPVKPPKTPASADTTIMLPLRLRSSKATFRSPSASRARQRMKRSWVQIPPPRQRKCSSTACLPITASGPLIVCRRFVGGTRCHGVTRIGTYKRRGGTIRGEAGRERVQTGWPRPRDNDPVDSLLISLAPLKGSASGPPELARSSVRRRPRLRAQ